MSGPRPCSLWAFGIAVSLLAAGCAGKPILNKPPKPAPVSVSVVAGEALNPDSAGRPSPVFLRIYALRDTTAFGSADFDALAGNDEALLAAVIVQRNVMTLRPGDSAQFTWELDPAVKALAAMAEFRDPLDSSWRAILPMTGKLAKRKGVVRVSLQLDGASVRFELAD